MYDFTKQYDARILISGRSGLKPTTEYHHSDGNIYVEGRKNSEYELEFYNNSGENVCVIPAVDGLSVMDGEPAGLKSDGYVVNAWSTVKIPGWRLDNNEVAKFQFSGENQSYASKSGNDTGNTGVIGFMIFREEQAAAITPWDVACSFNGNSGGYAGSLNRGTKYGNPIMNNARSLGSGGILTENIVGAACSDEVGSETLDSFSSELGTSFGEATDFQTRNVSFAKRDPNNPDAVMVIYYDTAKGLEKRGIVVRKKRGSGNPDPFPNYKNDSSGCTPPKNWRG